MNIKQAKEQIKYAISAYLMKNEHSEYIIPIQAQRPLFVMGAPGIGKTDIMKQIAEELSIGMVSYSMTHHTRQSALGLPFIIDKEYNGEKYQVSEYTMSEILSSIYDVVENYGAKEGILFLDEINCVSETLAPSMLQFLQFKTFGKHKVPDGWVVVTAGNPPEYNNSVKEFDIVTWDRLKRLDVEPDFQTWIEHAKICGVHAAITSYLELKQHDFYKVETTVDGKTFVTARGWVDLSQMIRLFEKSNFPVDETLVGQYLQDKQIAKNFSIYYDLFKKYRSDYGVADILAGKEKPSIVERAKSAPFDERLALITMIIEALTNTMREVSRKDEWGLAFGKEAMILRSATSIDEISQHLKKLEENLNNKRNANSISSEEIYIKRKTNECFVKMIEHFNKEGKVQVKDYSKQFYTEHKKAVKKEVEGRKKEVENALSFAHKAFGENDQAFFLVMTELTTNLVCADFLNKYGDESYYKYNKQLLVHEIQKDLQQEIDDLKIDDIDDLWNKIDERNDK